MDLELKEKIACVLRDMYPKTNTHNFGCSVWSIFSQNGVDLAYLRKSLSDVEKERFNVLFPGIYISEHNII